MSARVEAIHIAPAHAAEMQPIQQATLLAGGGIEGDRYANGARTGGIMLMSAEHLERLDLWPGSARENITTRGLDLMTLAPGTRLHIGGAVMEVIGAAPPCAHNDKRRNALREMLGGQRGLLCRALEGGAVRIGDGVRILE